MRLLAALLVAAALAGSAAASGPVRRHTAHDNALARRMLIVRGDLGKGWTSTPARTTASALTCSSFDPKQSDLVETGVAQSPNLRGSATGPFVSQVAWVLATRAQATKLWRRVVGPGLLRCLVASVSGGSTSKVTFTIRQSGELAVPKLARQTAGYRVVATAKTPTQSFPTYYDMFVLAAGRVVTQISFAEFGRPIPSAVELLLGRRVASRLAAAAGAA